MSQVISDVDDAPADDYDEQRNITVALEQTEAVSISTPIITIFNNLEGMHPVVLV
jgi:hypothetical protein